MAKRKNKYSQRSSMDKSLDKSLKGFWIRF
jgi:hypothetical protein